jgi:LPXTG-site transpeptidase (sortase) family protein
MTLRQFNNFLSVIVIMLGMYISASPFLPNLTRLTTDKSPEASAPYAGVLADSIGSSTTTAIPEENRIVIPSIQVNEPILEGSNIWVINKGGTWRRPQTSTPTQNNNTVVVGHRYYGNNISTLYHLDKVLIGQKIAVYWEGKEILYEVTETKIVKASAVEIEAPTKEKQLTIYTCHPIWTAKERMVVIAKPIIFVEENS